MSWCWSVELRGCRPEATSVNTIARTIGSSIGTAVIAAVISANTTPQGLPTDDAFTTGFWVCAAVAEVLQRELHCRLANRRGSVYGECTSGVPSASIVLRTHR